MAGKSNAKPESGQPAPRSIRFTPAQDAALVDASKEADPVNPNVSSLVRDIVEGWRRLRETVSRTKRRRAS